MEKIIPIFLSLFNKKLNHVNYKGFDYCRLLSLLSKWIQQLSFRTLRAFSVCIDVSTHMFNVALLNNFCNIHSIRQIEIYKNNTYLFMTCSIFHYGCFLLPYNDWSTTRTRLPYFIGIHYLITVTLVSTNWAVWKITRNWN